MTTLQFSESADTHEPLILRKQLLNHIVDGVAMTRPNAVWAEMPESPTTYESGYRKITYRQLANAINGVAWWLSKSLGQSRNFETLAYFGPWDVRYVILLLGAVKAGYKMLFPSPGYSLAGLALLLDQTQCKTILVPSTAPPIVATFLANHSLNTLDVPSAASLLDDLHPHYPFEKRFETAQNEPLVVLHTSGTTSHPKPVLWTHGYGASLMWQNQLPPPAGYESVDKLYQGNRLLSLLPIFHAGNLFGNLFTSIANQTIAIYPLSNSGLGVDTLINVLDHVQVDVVVGSPVIAEGLASNSTLLNSVSSRIAALGYAGGDISRATGNTIAKLLKLFSVYAQTENGINATIRPIGAWGEWDWRSIHLHPQAGYEFRRRNEEEYELVIVRNSDSEKEQPVFKVFPLIQEWPTKDLFTPDPCGSGAWIYRSRTDDNLTFNDGTTFNPLLFEQHVNGHPDVRDVLMLGSRRPQAALLVELKIPEVSSGSKRTEMIDRIWPLIAEANVHCTTQSTIDQSHIFFALPDKPIPRAGKGTVQREPAAKLYSDELAGLY